LIASLAKLARRGSRFVAAYFVVARGRKRVPSLLLSTPARDPGLIASLAKLVMLNCSLPKSAGK
jgi:hypothetical protein